MYQSNAHTPASNCSGSSVVSSGPVRTARYADDFEKQLGERLREAQAARYDEDRRMSDEAMIGIERVADWKRSMAALFDDDEDDQIDVETKAKHHATVRPDHTLNRPSPLKDDMGNIAPDRAQYWSKASLKHEDIASGTQNQDGQHLTRGEADSDRTQDGRCIIRSFPEDVSHFSGRM
ncbi:hypothetical protein F5Y15DRAFT_28926 [Xylariaceae sp. FL0016]|nr:hypothetical protein F5Y15DRAFT_28926 [Xylariaceae sp. FL0016]